jgi:hypothetical protein
MLSAGRYNKYEGESFWLIQRFLLGFYIGIYAGTAVFYISCFPYVPEGISAVRSR